MKTYEKFEADIVHGDLFDLDIVLNSLRKLRGRKAIFLFQVVDALESFQKNYSKKLLLELSKKFLDEDIMVYQNNLELNPFQQINLFYQLFQQPKLLNPFF